MSVAVQVVNGREQGTEEEEASTGQAEAMEETPTSPREEVMSDGEDQSGAPKKKKFKPWKSLRNMFKKKKSPKGSEGDGDPSTVANKRSMSKSMGELEVGGDGEGELNKRISMSEDSVFTADKPAPTKEEVRTSFQLNSSNLADEINAKLKERASSSDDGFAQSSEDAMTTGDITQDNSELAPCDGSKTDSGIITTEDEPVPHIRVPVSNRRWKSFTSVGAKDNQHARSDVKRLRRDNPGDIDLDLIQGSNLLSSLAARHRISVAPSNRRPSQRARARTPEKRSSIRLDDVPAPIEEEPSIPKKSPAPLILDNEEKSDNQKERQEKDIPIVIIDMPPPEDQEKPLTIPPPSPPPEETPEIPMMLPEPKEVIIIMKDPEVKKEPEKEPEKEAEKEADKEAEKEVEEAEEETEKEPEKEREEVKEESKEVDSPTTVSPVPRESNSSEGVFLTDIKEDVNEESMEPQKEPKKTDDFVEERRLSVAASKALFEAKIPVAEPVKTSSNKTVINGNTSHKGDSKLEQGAQEVMNGESAAGETKAEADTKVTEKEKKAEEKEKSVPVIQVEKDEEEKEEEEQLVSLKDRISRYQNLASKTKGKSFVIHTTTRSSPTKQRPASTSNIENKESPRKVAPKVLSKPSSTSFSKPSSMAMTTDTSKPSTNIPASASSSSTTTTSLSLSSTVCSSSPLRKPLAPKIDHCMVCEKPVYQNEMSKVEGRIFHRTCQKCSECSRTLTLWNVDIAGERLYCKQHGKVVKDNLLKERLIIQ